MSLSKNRFAQGGCAKFELILEEISGSLNLFWFYLAILLVFSNNRYCFDDSKENWAI